MLHKNIQSELFVELSHKQQHFIAGGGGPTMDAAIDATEQVTNTLVFLSKLLPKELPIKTTLF
jgi:hypothetical protein